MYSPGAFATKRRCRDVVWLIPALSIYRLTLGLMGLDELHLRVLSTSSEDLREKKNAQKGHEISRSRLRVTDESTCL